MKTKVLFVCMGNICRSPTAHGVMQHKVEARALGNRIEIDSAGTHAYHVGEQSDPRSRSTAARKGIDMDFIRARKISILDYDEYDYILAMDADNLDLIQYYAPKNYHAKVSLFLAYANQAGTVDEHEVPDPYYGGEAGFEHVFSLVDRGCDALIEHILSA
ncbi:phosphotyrosine protein phosphatase [Arenicella chitinivorans]|uniref:protein-tyrosine-phosphatase n=1 Tax=Arenicella chitinivorans TaxID=1329800 RepID=A0A918RWR7_9GAMM|nr:low molecular weight protein-tyrosine-phosphatase [Arenicella chitinivorans]GHA15521.1 phosphotyrosine protein phosphatase [Arenicella chitinivorans]